MPASSPNTRRSKTFRRTMLMSVSIGVAALLAMVPLAPVSSAAATSAPCTRTDVTCALILGGTTLPTPDGYYVETVGNQYIEPTHPDRHIEYLAVTTPQEFWPLTGLFRLLELALGPPELGGLDGPAWPDEPWWKLSGLFDLTVDQSVAAGVADLEAAMAAQGNDDLVIYGLSQGAGVANVVKQRLAEKYPAGTEASNIDFVLSGDPNLPNGGLAARFPGLYVPVLDMTLNGPAPTDTQFDTVEINRQYDGFSDFPLYPLNLVSSLNALLGTVYVHTYSFDVSLAGGPSDPTLYQGTHGDTTYYLFENPDLPLFGPLRTLGVPEPMIDVVEPFFRVIVELGYDRSIPPWQPTPARLIPMHDPATVAADLADAVDEGIDNAQALTGSAPPSRVPAADTDTDHAGPESSGPVVEAGTDIGDSLQQVGENVETTIRDVTNSVTECIKDFSAPNGTPSTMSVGSHCF